MTDKLWKQAERKIAALLGGEREPVSGRQRGDKPDIQHASFSVEVKHRQTLPSWIKEAMEQAEASSTNGKTPVAILHEKGKTYSESLVLIKLRDLIVLKNKIDELEEEITSLKTWEWRIE